jgi:integrase
LLAVQVSDLDVGERAGKVIIRMGKHGRYREVPLSANVRKALREYLDTLPPGTGWLWSGQRGELRTRSAVNRLLEKYAILAGVESFGPHTLRHTFSTRYLEANPDDLRGLAALLGHASLNTVMIYTTPDLPSLQARIERAG